METGNVLLWTTDKAKGHGSRRKYHIFICEGDWVEERKTFLFISSHDYFNDFEITRSDWREMPNSSSFISCNSPVFYSDSELRSYTVTPTGSLSTKCLRRLALHIQDSDVMERRQIARVVASLYRAIK